MSDEQDVNVVSSTTEQTTETPVAPNDSQESATEESVQTGPQRLVPLDELIEVRSSNKELKSTIEELNRRISEFETRSSDTPKDPNMESAKEQIKALGFITKEEQERILAQKEADATLERNLIQLENSYTGEDGRPKFNRKEVIDYAIKNGIPSPEIAYKVMKEKELMDWHIQQAIVKSKGVKSEQSDGSGSQQSGTTDADLKAGIKQGSKDALHTYLKRISKS